MCNKNSPPPTPTPSPSQTKGAIMRKTRKQTKDLCTSSSTATTTSSTTSSSLKPVHGRRNRTKKRKPKYLSLRLQLSKNQNQVVPKTQHQKNKTTQQQQQQQQQPPQLKLFPLHPENTDVMHEEHNVALLFSSDGGGTLNGLLEDESTTTAATAAASEEGSISPPEMTCPALVRKAMRRRNKDEGREEEEEEEERWVCYSEVVEKKEMMEEVASYCPDPASFGLLSLKLDHEGILNAWSDKGSLYVAGEAPQTVPDFHNHVLLLNNSLPPNLAWGGWGSDVTGSTTWNVPESCGANKMQVISEEMGWKLGQREASVLRYKEKRQNRLFSKKIRYEVRKLNAEKRPRMKGRFVKRE